MATAVHCCLCENKQSCYSQGEGALVQGPPRTLRPKTPQVLPFVMAFEQLLVLPAATMPIPIDSAFSESTSEYFENSKAPFKRFSSYCSTVRR